MARGQRTNLADLAGAVGDKSPVDTSHPKPEEPGRSVPLTDLTANPRNPRDDVGDLADLASITDIQLQPALVVSKAAYLKLYPDDPIATRYVVINGCRRLAAAHKYGRSDLAIVVNDGVARDRITLISACIAENVDRQDFDVIEEARAVEALIAECGRAVDAANRLHKTEAWVSQRRALLKLAPELQTALRRGELAIRDARQLARVPLAEQVARWQATLDRNTDGGTEHRQRPPSRSRVIASALADFDTEPDQLAHALRTYLGADGVDKLMVLLRGLGN
ncbi:ParB N-terminal domain-containing protein [Mycolicibacterium austroafricanum]|jgi:ParB family chromosome partitioning protein|uniref:ParB N-terminal domain-containing protein n=1 Tax=Mycolicibacterium austroafricanum TaxID=39687 RepID=A0ABT8H8L9_MYCAO|nr:ParB N-terminal domain-containing protein [Mycolicibacterium austroafricanum]MDN4517102.1 ParB N-terminal domain-containing protein [Mycolicibacterium austroafricanum]